MDAIIIRNLAEVIYDEWNINITKADTKKRINGIFHNRSTKRVIQDFAEYMDTLQPNSKKRSPLAILIVTLALFRRNLDDNEIEKELDKQHLVKPLYGGLIKLLSGNSQQIKFRIQWSDSYFNNKYDFLTKFNEFYYWEYIEIFYASKVVYDYESALFESLVLRDKSNLLILNILSGHFEVNVSDQLISQFLCDSDELRQNIGMALLMKPFTTYVEKIEQIKFQKQIGVEVSKTPGIRTIKRRIRTEVNHVYNVLNSCDLKIRTSLIFNYLVTTSTYPAIFEYWLMDENAQEYIVQEVEKSGKIETLKEVFMFLQTFSKRRKAMNGDCQRIKNSYYNALINVLVYFVKERKGIYFWGENEKKLFGSICNLLPMRYLSKLQGLLRKELEGLMVSKLDQLIRFHFYLKDRAKGDIVEGMLEEIDLHITLKKNHNIRLL